MSTPSTQHGPRRYPRALRDLVVVAVLVAGTFAVAASVDLFERFAAWTRAGESWEADELLFAGVAAALSCCWLSYRRWREGRLAQQQLRDALEGATEGIIIHRDGRVLFANQASADIFAVGIDTVYATAPDALICPGGPQVQPGGAHQRAATLEKMAFVGASVCREWHGTRRDGAEVWLDRRDTVVLWEEAPAIQLAVYDITARKLAERRREELEVRARQARDMELIGTLAGGVAHDFNNVLTAVRSYSELVRESLDPESAAIKDLRHITDAVDRGSDLVRRILMFGSQEEVHRHPLLPADVAREVVGLLRAAMPENVNLELKVDVAAESAFVLADATDLYRVLVNLCSNAEHAMRPQGGRVDVRVEIVECPAAGATGECVRVLVHDTGPGIPAAVRDRVFEPYFTTKPAGEGSGIGLAVVRGIVASHDGRLDLQSDADRGTCFTIDLPRIDHAPTDDRLAAEC